MRVIAGSLGGRQFEAPKGKVTHPMSERVKGALFNSLGDLSEKSVLDAFAGTGALGFEAYSRGARGVVLVEKDFKTFKLLEQNLESLGVKGQVKAIRANVSSWLDNNLDRKFDLIICDPPFDKRQDAMIIKLAKQLNGDGTLVVSQSNKLNPVNISELTLMKSKEYGDQELYYYIKN